MSFIRNAKNLVVSGFNAVKRGVTKLAVVTVLGTAAAFGVSAAVPSVVHAAGTLTAPTIDLTDFYAVIAVIMTAIAAIWIARKILGFFGSR